MKIQAKIPTNNRAEVEETVREGIEGIYGEVEEEEELSEGVEVHEDPLNETHTDKVYQLLLTPSNSYQK